VGLGRVADRVIVLRVIVVLGRVVRVAVIVIIAVVSANHRLRLTTHLQPCWGSSRVRLQGAVRRNHLTQSTLVPIAVLVD
jgi:hypothetical protein